MSIFNLDGAGNQGLADREGAGIGRIAESLVRSCGIEELRVVELRN